MFFWKFQSVSNLIFEIFSYVDFSISAALTKTKFQISSEKNRFLSKDAQWSIYIYKTFFRFWISLLFLELEVKMWKNVKILVTAEVLFFYKGPRPKKMVPVESLEPPESEKIGMHGAAVTKSPLQQSQRTKSQTLTGCNSRNNF